MANLGVNIDHVATIRQARMTVEPDPLFAMFLCEKAGCHGITIHLRKDERHIQKADVYAIRERVRTKLNLEMSIDRGIVDIATDVQPQACCIVPENRAEITTEGGLAVTRFEKEVSEVTSRMREVGSEVSLFIDPDKSEIDASVRAGAQAIELHTGTYANAVTIEAQEKELQILAEAAEYAASKGLIVNAGHGLTYHNILPMRRIEVIHEYNIGHSIISRAVFSGLENAVKEMLALLE